MTAEDLPSQESTQHSIELLEDVHQTAVQELASYLGLQEVRPLYLVYVCACPCMYMYMYVTCCFVVCLYMCVGWLDIHGPGTRRKRRESSIQEKHCKCWFECRAHQPLSLLPACAAYPSPYC